MTQHSAIEQLPEVIPIFPLEGVLLLPRAHLPLNIFEKRYVAMTRDALAGDGLVGMVQPCGKQDCHGETPIYRTGGVGRISTHTQTPDGRYLLTLTGLCRFEVVRELPLKDGYRRVVADYTRYRTDVIEDSLAAADHDRLVTTLRAYFTLHGIPVEGTVLDDAPNEMLITTVAMACPFDPREKQALLETANLSERCQVMITLIEMALHRRQGLSQLQ